MYEYRLFKNSGYGATLTVENMMTKATVVIGNFNSTIRDILEEHGYEIPPYSDEWNIELSDDTAKALCMTTMSMKKPIRNQKKDSTELKSEQSSAEVDAFDLIYGIT